MEHQRQNAAENINNDPSEHLTLQLRVAMAKTGGGESTGMPRNENQQHLNEYNSYEVAFPFLFFSFQFPVAIHFHFLLFHMPTSKA